MCRGRVGALAYAAVRCPRTPPPSMTNQKIIPGLSANVQCPEPGARSPEPGGRAVPGEAWWRSAAGPARWSPAMPRGHGSRRRAWSPCVFPAHPRLTAQRRRPRQDRGPSPLESLRPGVIGPAPGHRCAGPAGVSSSAASCTSWSGLSRLSSPAPADAPLSTCVCLSGSGCGGRGVRVGVLWARRYCSGRVADPSTTSPGRACGGDWPERSGESRGDGTGPSRSHHAGRAPRSHPGTDGYVPPGRPALLAGAWGSRPYHRAGGARPEPSCGLP